MEENGLYPSFLILTTNRKSKQGQNHLEMRLRVFENGDTAK